MADIRIVKSICSLSETVDGWQKELNVVSVDGGPFAYDIREWRLDHFDYRDGITLYEKEAAELLMNLRRCFGLKDSDLDSAQIEMPEMAEIDLAAGKKPDVLDILKEKEVAFIDKRERGGALWVIGDRELEDLMMELKQQGYLFVYSEKGGKATKNKSAWFLRGAPRGKA